MLLKPASSTRFGSHRMSRTSSGVALMSRLQMTELIDTLFPEPVCPAMRRCGSFARSATIGEPDTSRPSATVSFELASLNIAVAATSFRVTIPIARFGTSIPTTDFPGTGASMRNVRAASASERSLSSDSMRESFTPAAGFSS